MATLVLTTVGSLFGGPIGAAVGAFVGQQIDQRLFAPKARHGPRLGDLSVQTSSYGSPVPRVFGRMRVAGTVIWSTDLIETRSRSGGGKGRPRVVTYSYSASFAVALSARRIRSIGRIWADGKLLRGAAGDFKSGVGAFRLHSGDEDQLADPLIASAEGAGLTPAWRGTAYAVFEQLRLEDFGNRIPSLTFEVEADVGAVAIGAVAEELGEGAIASGPTPALIGYAASGDSVRAALEALADVVPLSIGDRGGTLRIEAEPGPPSAIAHADESSRREIVRRSADSVPAEVTIAYHEPERDYQTGLQRATASGGPAPRNADRRALPAAISAAGAKALAEYRLAALRSARTAARLELSWRAASFRPGDTVQVEGETGLWRVHRWTLERMRSVLELGRVPGATLPDPSATSGRPVREADLRHGPTVLRLIQALFGDRGGAAGGAVRLFAAAAGPEPGWRRAGLAASLDGGATWQEVGPTAAPAMLGTALDALAASPSTIFDRAGSVEVELLHAEMWLEHASDSALAGGANLAAIGDELVQFGRADWLGGTRFRLSRLLRGRLGTEWAAEGHESGEPFTLIERDSLAAVDLPPDALGAAASVGALGIGDAEMAVATLEGVGEALRPPSPVHLRAERLAGGSIAIAWVRRSRLGWEWTAGADAPLGEESEAYRIVLSGAGFARTAVVSQASYVYTAAEQAIDGAAGTIAISVAQIGTYAASRPTAISFE